MYSDRNLINRRCVKSDVDSAVNADRHFFALELESRIVAAEMQELGMEDLDEVPESVLSNVQNWTNSEKKEYLTKLSSSIVDKYILDEAKHKKIVVAVDQLEERQLQRLKDRTSDGRYHCRFPGCKEPLQLMENGDRPMNNPITHQ